MIFQSILNYAIYIIYLQINSAQYFDFWYDWDPKTCVCDILRTNKQSKFDMHMLAFKYIYAITTLSITIVDALNGKCLLSVWFIPSFDPTFTAVVGCVDQIHPLGFQ